MNPTSRPPGQGMTTALSAPARPSFPHSRWAQMSIAPTAFGVYALAFLPLSGLLGSSAAALATVSLMAAGCLLGTGGGLLDGVLINPLNMLLLNLASYPGRDVLIRQGGGPGTFALILIGLGIGRLQDLSDRLKL
jgi:hypothetical protein